MITLIGLIVAAYAVVRLAQVPAEAADPEGPTGLAIRWWFLALTSAAGIAVVLFLTRELITRGDPAPAAKPPETRDA